MLLVSVVRTLSQHADVQYVISLVPDAPIAGAGESKKRPGEYSSGPIFYDHDRNVRMTALLGLIVRAGGKKPTVAKPEVKGHFTCSHCPEDKIYTWTECLSHMYTKTSTKTVEPNGIRVIREADHDKITFVKNVETADTVTANNEDEDELEDEASEGEDLMHDFVADDEGDGYNSDGIMS